MRPGGSLERRRPEWFIVLVPLAWGRARYWKGWHQGRADLLREQQQEAARLADKGIAIFRSPAPASLIADLFRQPYDREAE